MSTDTIDDVISFWFDGLSPKQWYRPPRSVDEEIASQFRATYDALKDGVPSEWLETARGYLAAILVLDQFPRNMFRDEPRAFATDDKALNLAKEAIAKGFDRELRPAQRAFIYLPFQHTEALADQERSVGLFTALGNPLNLDYAIRHRDVIARFGRFPHRNAILGRRSTAEEKAFLKQPGSSF